MSVNIKSKSKKQRLFINVNGIVQGVGFRPFVYNLARELYLSGFVSNSSKGVQIEIEGSARQISSFLKKLSKEPPPLSEISNIDTESIPVNDSVDFVIKTSVSDSDNQTLISPDMAICNDCLAELRDKNNRRFQYPFINCTNCGPRFTIIKNIPYDRPFTSMAEFKMCPECQKEYDDPSNRRFHAQPNACQACGPVVWYEQAGISKKLADHDQSIVMAVEDLTKGLIIAVKGLGGFHLAVDATNKQAVLRLRKRKNREEKPLAIMVAGLDAAKKLCRITKKEAQLLCAPQRPILLLEKRDDSQVAESVAPGNNRLGIMLPYTPLHYILFDRLQNKWHNKGFPALVMTSANLSEEPIAISNEDASKRLENIADRFLMHNRDILIRADDSVMIFINDSPVFFRRSRGYVPRPVFLKDSGPAILALGGELKNTISLLKQNKAFLSQHVGDLENLQANRFFNATAGHLQQIMEAKPDAIVSDMHPGYFSTQWADQQKDIKKFKIQHHHAHMAACMAEWQLSEPVIGIILDGTGYGYDKTIWGGEILVGNYTEIKRFAWLEPMPLPGGDKVILEPWRTAISYLYSAYGKNIPELPFLKGLPVHIIQEMIDKKINTIQTSSCGRLFDAVAAMSGGRQHIRYEAQAAIEMMQKAADTDLPPYDFQVQAPLILIKPLIREIVNDLIKKRSFSIIAGRFHKTLIKLFTAAAAQARKMTGIRNVVLSGGVMQNEILSAGLIVSLEKADLKVYSHKQVPANDGGISLGQAAIGQQLLKRGLEEVEYRIMQ